MNPYLKRVLGEKSEKPGNLIPDDAEEVSKSANFAGKPLRKITNTVQEPSYPADEREELMTPKSALTAPDCTPGAFDPLDPDDVPGSQGPQRFTAADLANAGEVPEEEREAPETGLGNRDPGAKAMDDILGRKRTIKAKDPRQFSQEAAVASESAAADFVDKLTVQEDGLSDARAKAAVALTDAQAGGTMPEPSVGVGNGAAVYRAMRNLVG